MNCGATPRVDDGTGGPAPPRRRDVPRGADPQGDDMHPTALPVRTLGEPATFHELMAEQLRHAPWLLVSVLAHAVFVLVVWLLLPANERQRAPNSVAMMPAADPDVAPPPTPPELVPPEPTVLEPRDVIADVPIDAPVAASDAADSTALDAFPTDTGSSLLGMGSTVMPGAGGALRGSGCHRGARPAKGHFLPAIDAALRWLVAHQDEDGKWDCDGFMKHDVAGEPCTGAGNGVHDVGVTGLALLAFLGDGHSMRAGAHRDVVRRAVRWLREHQNANGRFGSTAASDFVYDHAIAAYAMCEAYGLSQYSTLRPIAQRGLDYLATHRNPYGAWRYQPRDGDSDTSVTGWCVLAMCSGRQWGLAVDANGLALAAQAFDACTSPDGHCGYQRAGELSARKAGGHAARFPADRTDALTAAGLFCRYFLGQQPEEQPLMRAAADRLQKRLPRWDEQAGTIDHYYWYYATYALFQFGGAHWREWSKALRSAVVATQCKDGNAAGSWDPVDAWGEDGGRVYSTAILALTLEAYYRYTRLVPGGR
jgi:hypothetical protein